MHLKHIKLVGFKSFADAVHIPIPGQRVGIVGPNGCGKSNVIDAVRWVLGESQARQLRGESLQDVIFGGSAQRKPQGRASVELVFDNSAGRAPGLWSSYAEICVKRVMTRNGVSRYTINETMVRRRDVQDIFLGTGLGPRAYAIIEQGMITRIIEARPEEIRVFLEEVAGISRYRERRRETLQHLTETRPNLERIRDTVQELTHQIEKVKKQAERAEHWKALRARHREAEARWYYGRWKIARAEQGRGELECAQMTEELKQMRLTQEGHESLVEATRLHWRTRQEMVRQAQGALYQANHALLKAESSVHGQHQERQRMERDGQRLHAQWDAERQQWEKDQRALKDLEEQQEALHQAILIRQEQSRAGQAACEQLRQGLTRSRQTLEQARQTEQGIERQWNQQHAEQEARCRALEHILARRQRLEKERSGLCLPDSKGVSEGEILARNRAVSSSILEASEGSARLRLSWCRAQVESRRESLAECTARRRVVENTLQGLQSQEEESERGTFVPEDTVVARFWQHCQVEPRWEKVVEFLLGVRLKALRRDHLPTWTELIDRPRQACAFYHDVSSRELAERILPGLSPLSRQVRSEDPTIRGVVNHWLHGWYVCADLECMLAWAGEWVPGLSLVTPEGHQRDAHSLTLWGMEEGHLGTLARAREIRRLSAELPACRKAEEEAHRCLAIQEEGRERVAALVLDVERRLQQLRKQQHQEALALTQVRAEQERIRQEWRRLEKETETLVQAETLETQGRSESMARLGGLDRARENARAATEAARAQCVREEASWEQCQKEGQILESACQEARFAQRSAAEKLDRLNTTQNERQQRMAGYRADLERLQTELQALDEETATANLEQALQAQKTCAAQLAQQQSEMETLEEGLRQHEECLLRSVQTQEPVRQALENLRLKIQEARLRGEQAWTSLAEEDPGILENLDRWWALTGHNEGQDLLMTQLEKAMNALGAVNLAALEELDALQQRHAWLAEQLADLEGAVQTLEQALNTIDREIRTQLGATVDQVNVQFARLFQELFEGGVASLQWLGEDILEAGVQLMAQPPGKKNSSLYLLSGGEKALTAMALIFALFQLNPAPFCLLDEVDAPLDDTNTERFARMVLRMSEHTQFLFITHNKVAMEMAQQLIGITMAESGVSRMVAVDVEEALRLTEQVIL